MLKAIASRMRRGNACTEAFGVIDIEQEGHLSKASNIINAHAIMSVQHSDLAAGADLQPVLEVVHGLECEGVQYQKGQCKVVHPVPLQSQIDVCGILLMHLTQQPAAGMHISDEALLDITASGAQLQQVLHSRHMRECSESLGAPL